MRQRHVEANRKILKRVIDTIIFLGKQKLAFCGHRELLANDPSVDTINFLETLKYLANYDDAIATHLKKVENDHREMEEKKKESKNKHSQAMISKINSLITSKEIALEIVNLMKGSVAWA